MGVIGKAVSRFAGGAIVLLAVVFLTAQHGNRALYPARMGDDVTIYIMNNGFHTDLALPADAVMAHGGVLAQAGSAAAGQTRIAQTRISQAWIVYGWGDLGFYTAKGYSVARALDGLRALFHPGNPSVIRVFGVDRQPDQAYQGATAIHVSRAGLNALMDHMSGSFTIQDGAPIAAPGVADDIFFKSREHFSILRLCNNWTSDQLAAAGLKTSPVTDGLAPFLDLDLRWRDGVR